MLIRPCENSLITALVYQKCLVSSTLPLITKQKEIKNPQMLSITAKIMEKSNKIKIFRTLDTHTYTHNILLFSLLQIWQMNPNLNQSRAGFCFFCYLNFNQFIQLAIRLFKVPLIVTQRCYISGCLHHRWLCQRYLKEKKSTLMWVTEANLKKQCGIFQHGLPWS